MDRKNLIDKLIEKQLLSKEQSEDLIKSIQGATDDNKDKAILGTIIEKGYGTLNNLLDVLEDDKQLADLFPPEVQEKMKDKNRILGKYVLINEIGTGGCGVVHKSYDTVLRRFVALKVLDRTSEDAMKRFQREAEIIARLAHPNIVPIYDIGNQNGKCYISMQYLQGKTMDKLHNMLAIKDCVEIIKLVCLAIEHAHKAGIIHRDIKPQNIFIDNTKNVFVVDFGVAKLVESDVTMTGTLLGTPMYMSPEQANGKEVDERSDIYSIGATLYHCTTKELPFTGTTAVDIITKVIDVDPQPPRKMNPKISRDLETIIQKCMFKDPKLRYKSTNELGDDLERYLQGEAITARGPSVYYRLQKKLKKHRVIVIASALIAIIIVPVLIHLYNKSRIAEIERISTELARSHLYDAEQHQKNNDIDAAIKSCLQALEAKPDEINAMTTLAVMYHYKGQYEKAIEQFEKVLKIKPDHAKALYEMGQSYRKIKKDDKALELMDKTIATSPKYVDAYLAKSDIFYLNKQLEEAAKWAEKAIEVGVHHARHQSATGLVHANLGSIYYQLGRYEEAIKRSQEAVKINPFLTQPHNTLGQIHHNRGDCEKAVKEYQAALKIDKNYFWANFNLGLHFLQQNLHNDALEYLELAVKIKPDYIDAQYALGMAYVGVKNKKAAMKTYKKLGKISSEHAKSLKNEIDLAFPKQSDKNNK
ncbi:MAG: tetratricopeptide repeat protein [Planctomycetes bacterium]|nr:tetratricopeptide repeat protein [Planctomycetota bacterium]